MMRRLLHTAVLIASLAVLSCGRELRDDSRPEEQLLPAGVPVMLTIPFGSSDLYEVSVSTRSDAGTVNESHIHDLYVMIFDNDDTATGSARKIYGRYFNFEHRRETLSELNSKDNECWYVENKDLGGSVARTRGAVKVSTITRDDVVIAILANVENAVATVDQNDAIGVLNGVEDLDGLRGLTVSLKQDVVNRKDFFLMLGTLGYNDGKTISTRSMRWNLPAPNDLNYDPDYTVSMKNVNAKVKFRIKVNTDNISNVTPVYWQVCSAPRNCYLFPDYDGVRPPADVSYFNSQTLYFEDTQIDEVSGDTYYCFCFYMLENRLSPTRPALNYYQRELMLKSDSGEDGYKGPVSPEFGSNYVNNGEWSFANPNSTYVRFDLVLTLTEDGITDVGSDESDINIGHALTSDAIFTVHLGNFTSSGKPDGWDGFNDYNTERNNYYTYTITINNTKKIYTEVATDSEDQPGEEGFLLLTDSEILNADAHYEYHCMEFAYRPDMRQDKFSWYVKTPFSKGGPTITPDLEHPGKYIYTAENLDYEWVKFGINALDGGIYTDKRSAYPGDSHYHPEWEPGMTVDDHDGLGAKDIPDLMNITQLIQLIFSETTKETAHRADPSQPESLFISDGGGKTPVIRVTAYIDEYYYEVHPIDKVVDPELWRKFVNAEPRELHILSDAQSSRDRQSDVILSSHSVIQQSIQTIYNTAAPDLSTLWGTEHKDEMRSITSGWPYWPYTFPGSDGTGYHSGTNNDRAGKYGNDYTEIGRENGRLNSAYIWDFFSSQGVGGSDNTGRNWNTYLDFNVRNGVPELRENYHGMAWSCLTRNRDNNGDGIVDRNEVRWYLAASSQLVGMWVGNAALSLNARLYKPIAGQWRAHIVSSSDRRTCWSEEGAGATPYEWDFDYDARFIWHTVEEASAGESVRCLRNIGTFNDGGVVKDISEAPYKQEIDKYFTLTDNGDNSYTFYFDRLSPKALREYCEGELPFHNQFSVSNSVYLQLTTQKRSDNVGDTAEDAFTMTAKTINPDVTEKGYNPYCPPGYRFPNQTEMVLMGMYLPNGFFDRDKDGNKYGSGYYMPTRTYFDRGVFGGVTTNMNAAEIAREGSKAGWGYSTGDHRTHCANQTQEIKRSRCVRDDDLTGYIDGGITMPTSELYPNDSQKVKFSFFSSASGFVSASLKLCYTAHNDSYYERDIPLQTAPTGLQYEVEQKIDIPTLAALGMVGADLDTDKKNMKFKVELRNAAGYSRSFELPFVLASHLTGSSMELPAEYDPDKGMVVRVNIGSKNTHSRLSNVILHWKAVDGSWNTKELVAHDYYNTYSEDFYTEDIIGAATWAVAANKTKEYLYYVTADCDDGTSFTSPTISEQILRLDYTPNPVPDGGWTNISQCSTTWSNTVTGLNFSKGDFIEADMDLTACRYKFIDGNADHDIGKDNLIGYSTDNLSNIKNSFFFYYPSVQNQINSDDPAEWGWIRSRAHAGKWAENVIDEGVLTHLNMILDKDGIIRDGTRYTRNPGEWNSRVKAALTSASTVYVGSVEGVHHSRATYNYVRVVRYKD